MHLKQIRDVFRYFKDVLSKYLNIFNEWTLGTFYKLSHKTLS